MELMNQYAVWQEGDAAEIDKVRCPDLAAFVAATGSDVPGAVYAAIMHYAPPSAATLEYVVGFAFTPNSRVVLIDGERHGGKLNGVGGRIKIGEGFYSAMIREFREKTGVDHQDWRVAGVMTGSDWRVYVMTAKSESFWVARTMTDEKVSLHPTGAITTSSPFLAGSVAALVTLCDLGTPSPPKATPFFVLRY